MAKTLVLIVVNTPKIETEGVLGNISLLDSNGYHGVAVGKNHPTTQCFNGDKIVYSIQSTDPTVDLNISMFTGYAINEGLIKPEKQVGPNGKEYWAAEAVFEGERNSSQWAQFTFYFKYNGKSYSYNPFIQVKATS